MVSDWVKLICKWSKIAFLKNDFYRFWSLGKNRKNRFFLNAICDHLQISLT